MKLAGILAEVEKLEAIQKRGCRQVLDTNGRIQTSAEAEGQCLKIRLLAYMLVSSLAGSICLPFSLVLVTLRICARLGIHIDHRER